MSSGYALLCSPRNISSQAAWGSRARARGPQPVTPLWGGWPGSRLGWSGPSGSRLGRGAHSPAWVGAMPVTAFRLGRSPRPPPCLALVGFAGQLALLPEPSDLAEVSMYLARDGVS